MAGWKRGLVPVAALGLLAAWWLKPSPDPRPPAAPDPSAVEAGTAGSALPAVAPVRGVKGMQGLRIPGTPDSVPSPAELEALRAAEIANSKAHPPVATYRGSDGQQHAFRYEATPQEELARVRREEREAALMRELEADPAAFARKYKLSAREVERMLDGSLPLPADPIEN